MPMDLPWHLPRMLAAVSSGGMGGGERGVTGRHGHHRDSCEDLVSKGEEKLGIRKVRLGLSRNSHEGFSNGTLFERVPQ